MMTTFAVLAMLGMTFTTEPAPTDSVDIEYGDLNLATTAGQEVLSKRIDRAARQVCGLDLAQTGSRIRDRGALACYTKAKARAQRQFAAVVEQHAKGG